jgi:dethiobiotin synthetase
MRCPAAVCTVEVGCGLTNRGEMAARRGRGAHCSYVERNTGRHKDLIETKNLYSYREPMSPHLAAILAPDLVRA